jgi:Arc/MetJ-type ribon-helix-helix transcriptional regulator
MTRPFDPADLPPDIARAAQAQVATGKFASIEDVLRAGIEAVAQEPGVLPTDWNEFLRHRFEAGRAALARGEAVATTPDELMDSINAELDLS